MSGVNKVMLLGNLGKDPEVKHLESGASVATFPIATSETYKDKQGNKQENTEWHNIDLWNKQAEIAEKYLSKGDSVFIEGKIKTDKYQDKEGNDRYITKIRGLQMTMLGKRQNNQEQAGGQQGGQGGEPEPKSDIAENPGGEDDLPF